MGFKQLIGLSMKVQQHLKTMEIRNISEFWQTRTQRTDSHTEMDKTIPQRETNEGGKCCRDCSHHSMFAYMRKMMHLR